MQFVRSSILTSVDGIHSAEKRAKIINTDGLNYFSNPDSFVSERSAEKKHTYSAEIEQRGGHRNWKNGNQNNVTCDTEEGVQTEFGPAAITQDEFEFLEFHAAKKKKQELANEKAVQEFFRSKSFTKQAESFLDRVANVQRNKEKSKETIMKNTLKSGFCALVIKKKQIDETCQMEQKSSGADCPHINQTDDRINSCVPGVLKNGSNVIPDIADSTTVNLFEAYATDDEND